MTDSIDTSEREADEPRFINLPVREMRDEPMPHQPADPLRAALQLALEATPDELPAALDALRQQIDLQRKEPFPGLWEHGEGWEALAWALCAEENGEEACTELVWEGGPIPEPWGDRWLKYEDEAKRLIALVHKHAHPQQPAPQPLTEAGHVKCVRCGQPTMRMGDVCYSCNQKATKEQP